MVRLYSRTHSIDLSAPTQEGAQVVFRGIGPGEYTVEVVAAGYEIAREEVQLWFSGGGSDVVVYLRPESAASTAPGPPGPPVLAPKARKETEKGLQALRANDLAKAQAHLERALRLAPGHPDVNYLLGALYLERKDLAQAKPYLEKATALDPKHRFALVSLGELLYRQVDLAGAIRTLEKALAIDPSAWPAHWLLASAYYRRGEFDKSRVHTERALKLGKGKASEAQLLLAQVLAALGERDKAVLSLESFLQDHPSHPKAAEARRLLEGMRHPREDATTSDSLLSSPVSAAIAPLPAAPLEPRFPSRRWSPPEVDEAVPAVATDVPCSVTEVLQAAGQRAKELVANLEKFTATERIEREEVDEAGALYGRQTRKFNYLASIREIPPGMLSAEETRNGGNGLDSFPTGLTTTGLAAFALVFHPYYVEDFNLACEGLGQWRGQPAWQVHFQQRPNRPSRFHAWQVRNRHFFVKLKGRAWIAADTYQVLRLETDLVEPLPEIRLQSEHLAIEYRPVQFHKRNIQLWLPESAEVHFLFQGHRYHHRHSLGDFLLFSVDVAQQIHDPRQQ